MRCRGSFVLRNDLVSCGDAICGQSSPAIAASSAPSLGRTLVPAAGMFVNGMTAILCGEISVQYSAVRTAIQPVSSGQHSFFSKPSQLVDQELPLHFLNRPASPSR